MPGNVNYIYHCSHNFQSKFELILLPHFSIQEKIIPSVIKIRTLILESVGSIVIVKMKRGRPSDQENVGIIENKSKQPGKDFFKKKIGNSVE